MRAFALLPALLLLPACSLFDDSDPREGEEATDDCVARVTGLVGTMINNQLQTLEGDWVPTFTYDVTKMSLEQIQALSVEGADDTAGQRLVRSTNELSTAIARFKNEPVSEQGAFFLGYDPAFYRVKGQPMPPKRILAEGCRRQEANMRLISVSFAAAPAPEETETVETETVEPEDETQS